MGKKPLVVTQELYDELMELPDGWDVSEYFDSEDPSWKVMKVTLVKVPHGRSSLVCRSVIAMEIEGPRGAQPDAAG